MLLSTGVTGGMAGLRVGMIVTTVVTTEAFVVVVVGGRRVGIFGLGVTSTGGLRVGIRGLCVLAVGIFLVGGVLVVVVVGEIRLAVTGGLFVVVGLLWSESGILLPPLLLFPGRGGSMTTFGMAERSRNSVREIHNFFPKNVPSMCRIQNSTFNLFS